MEDIGFFNIGFVIVLNVSFKSFTGVDDIPGIFVGSKTEGKMVAGADTIDPVVCITVLGAFPIVYKALTYYSRTFRNPSFCNYNSNNTHERYPYGVLPHC